MSGDAWEQCPICNNLPEEWRNGIDHLYGKVPLKEFKEIETKYNKLKSEKTVREDYEVGLDNDGTAWVSFYLKCQTCGAEWKHSAKDIKHTSGPKQI